MKYLMLLWTILIIGGMETVCAGFSRFKSWQKQKTMYFTWGYNRDWYSASTIHFKNTKTDNYDFTFIDAKAHDNPSMYEYWHLDRLTIPQYDMSIGVMLNDKHDLGIEISWNHLKYVVTDNQVIHVQGQIRGHYIDKDTLVNS